jgi:hypothetical protein
MNYKTDILWMKLYALYEMELDIEKGRADELERSG